MTESNKILNQEQILQKVRRIAYQIVEHNFEEKELFIIGIKQTGFAFAKLIKAELDKINHFSTHLHSITIDKKTPLKADIIFDCELNLLENKTVLLIDDVLNSGRTLAYSLKPILNIRVKKLQTCVLIDRDHKNFPIKADFVGYALSTTLKEHVTVSLDNKDFGVYLN